jgi:fructose-bisphosphate aldolase class II
VPSAIANASTFVGELGCLGSLETGEMGEEDGHGAEGKLDLDLLLTSVEEAADFVRATNAYNLLPRSRPSLLMKSLIE